MALASPLRELDAPGAATYLAERWRLPVEQIRATPLPGGISNHVVLLETPDQRLVLKQALAQLRVKEEWLSDRDRIFREAAAIAAFATLLPAGAVPALLFEDQDQFAYAMSAAPAAAESWKTRLLAGRIEVPVAAAVGALHAQWLQATWRSPAMKAQFGDHRAFEQLRVQPYYEYTAQRHPGVLDQAIARCRAERWCLVHGDWSPKNILVTGSQVMALDFEVIHYGDPAFDVAFLLNHLLLKSFHRPESATAYRAAAEAYWQALAGVGVRWLEAATLVHLPALLLARVDGKSPVEYLCAERQERVRTFALKLHTEPPASIAAAFERAGAYLG